MFSSSQISDSKEAPMEPHSEALAKWRQLRCRLAVCKYVIPP